MAINEMKENKFLTKWMREIGVGQSLPFFERRFIKSWYFPQFSSERSFARL